MIVALVSQKGGVGKSTTAIAIACEWSARGERVLLVDADPQGTVRTWAAVAAEAGGQPPAVVAMGQGMHGPSQLPRVAAGFSRVVIDCPGRNDPIVRSALMVSDLAILPAAPSPADAWALAETLQLVRDAQTLRPELRAVGLLTRVQSRTTVGRSARTVIASAGVEVLRAVLSSRVAYVEALAAGQGPAQYAPGDTVRLEIEKLVDEVEELFTEEEQSHVA